MERQTGHVYGEREVVGLQSAVRQRLVVGRFEAREDEAEAVGRREVEAERNRRHVARHRSAAPRARGVGQRRAKLVGEPKPRSGLLVHEDVRDDLHGLLRHLELQAVHRHALLKANLEPLVRPVRRIGLVARPDARAARVLAELALHDGDVLDGVRPVHHAVGAVVRSAVKAARNVGHGVRRLLQVRPLRRAERPERRRMAHVVRPYVLRRCRRVLDGVGEVERLLLMVHEGLRGGLAPLVGGDPQVQVVVNVVLPVGPPRDVALDLPQGA